MNWQSIRVVMIKDIKEIGKNLQFWLPTVLVPLIMAVVLPVVVSLIFSRAPLNSLNTGSWNAMFKRMPEALQNVFAGMTQRQAMVFIFANYLFKPFFLIIPVMVASIIAANSFAGERERKTIESLFYTPVSDLELLMGKVLAAFVPSVAVSWLAFAAFVAAVDATSFPLFGRLILPTVPWVLLLALLVPAVSFLSLAITVLISARVRGFQEAQQIAGALVVPILFLVFGQVIGLFILDAGAILAITVVLAVLDYLLVKIGAQTFSRERVITQL
ncbi:MAG: ABC transporter permease subunit [Firmicutes bacterium]|nr:ABC transporter permease subunit [Bacillota bacterium]